ncbi:MAG: hypothetical protein PUD81_06470 [Eggerthellales bacterium]|nr:hypothetical protein [Eggerthellales bacterium]
MVIISENATRCPEAEQKVMDAFQSDKATVFVQATIEDGVSRVEASITSLNGDQSIHTVKTGAEGDIDAIAEAAILELNYQGAVAILN